MVNQPLLYKRLEQACLLSLLVFVTCLLAACGTKGTRVPTDVHLVSTSWQRFSAHALANAAKSSPYRLSASLRYFDPKKDGHRVLTYLWGNGVDSLWPLRLDVQAGIGVMAAMIKDNRFGFLIYLPNEAVAYEYWGEEKPHFLADVPLPFSIVDLSLLLTGQYLPLFYDVVNLDIEEGRVPEAYVRPQGTAVGYNLAGTRLGGWLYLSPEGLPVEWCNDDGWALQIEIRDTDGAVPGPRKLVFTHAEGFEAIILVRERSKMEEPFTQEQLDLTLPPGTLVEPFDVGQ